MRLEGRPIGGLARGALPVGCRQCTDGAKMVLFVTGLCSFHCFDCPVSDEKMYRDVVYADEKRVERDQDVLDEAREPVEVVHSVYPATPASGATGPVRARYCP